MKSFLTFLSIATISSFIISCNSDDRLDEIDQNTFLSDLSNVVIFEPIAREELENPFGRPAVVANINNEDFVATHPSSIDLGIVNEVRSFSPAMGDLDFRLQEIRVGRYLINEFSGFNKIVYNNVDCTEGNIEILNIANNRMSGRFSFTGQEDNGNLVAEDGFFYDVPIPDQNDPSINHQISATINGENWESEIQDEFLGAATFVVDGYNYVGNVLIRYSSFYFIESGIYDLPNDQIQICLQIGKDRPALLSGRVRIENDSQTIRAEFDIEFEGFDLRDGLVVFGG